jgi:hypothetical protein
MVGNNLKLGLDLDGVITEKPEFFSTWTPSWLGEVVIITYRKDRQKAVQDLANRYIRDDELVLVDRFESKAEVIANLGAAFYIDDQPEMLKTIPASVNVMLFRPDAILTSMTNSGCLAVGQARLSAIQLAHSFRAKKHYQKGEDNCQINAN